MKSMHAAECKPNACKNVLFEDPPAKINHYNAHYVEIVESEFKVAMSTCPLLPQPVSTEELDDLAQKMKKLSVSRQPLAVNKKHNYLYFMQNLIFSSKDKVEDANQSVNYYQLKLQGDKVVLDISQSTEKSKFICLKDYKDTKVNKDETNNILAAISLNIQKSKFGISTLKRKLFKCYESETKSSPGTTLSLKEAPIVKYIFDLYLAIEKKAYRFNLTSEIREILTQSKVVLNIINKQNEEAERCLIGGCQISMTETDLNLRCISPTTTRGHKIYLTQLPFTVDYVSYLLLYNEYYYATNGQICLTVS